MHARTKRIGLIVVSIVVGVLEGQRSFAQPQIDGIVDTAYGAAVATDVAGDGNGQSVMDLREMYVTHTSDALFLAFRINGDVTAVNANWGKYVLYIDVTNDFQGATRDAWQRNVMVSDPHKPEYSINTWMDQSPYGANRTEIWSWSNNTWNRGASVSEAAMAVVAGTTVVEWKIPLSALGQPRQIWLELWSTSGTSTDNAQDTLNAPAEDWNALDWTSTATLSVSTPYQIEGATSDAGAVDARPASDLGVVHSEISVPDRGIPRDVKAVEETSPQDGPILRDLAAGQEPGRVDSAPLDGLTADVFAFGDRASALPEPHSLKVSQDEGCSCQTTSRPTSPGIWIGLAFLGVSQWMRSRRRRDP